ncbi:MAG: L-seryl-tRNA(Sec) selenium transferase [Anaerosomatales bacterium]|nr:L-seryl-tRNA(Sec) selenium transferase [Anaerosomatales bacterium]MDT8434128.1 L-seryl-tRNA(Sec) selenium transferase [Anaerosomatales bacterium]
MDTQDRLRQLPKVDELLRHADVERMLEEHPRTLVLETLRESIDISRARLLSSDEAVYDESELLTDARTRLSLKARRSLHALINATGIVVHTNLGRSILSERATAAVAEVASAYSTLEYDIASGERGSRHVHCEELLCKLTGAEAAMAVNNNAAAVMMAIAALARGKEAVVSRGQLVEIGGSFRIPDIMRESGATMVEVGTTNKTHLADYENAITEHTGVLLKVHSSNFRVVGFTNEVGLEELVPLGRKHGVPVFEDQGSGVLVDLRPWGLPYEPTVGESIAAGADLVSCSGDKLLGGPQAGILVGSAEIIGRLKKHPMARALRLDKMTLAALEVTLRTYLDPEAALAEIPTLRMITMPTEKVTARAESLAAAVREACGEHAVVDTAPDISRAGGGSLPLADIPTTVVRVAPAVFSAFELERRLRLGEPGIVARIKEDRLLLDLRTVLESEEPVVVERVATVLAGGE